MNELDLDGDGNGYSGTFRWKATKKLMSLPKFIGECEDLNYNSWMEFFSSRG